MNDRISQLLKRTPGAAVVTAEGWVRTKRESKNVCFLEINDGSCLKGLQAVVDLADFTDGPLLARITTGAALTCTGTLVASPGENQEVELRVESITLHGEAPADSYPLQKKRHTLEYLREIAHLRARTNTMGAVARVRHAVSYAVHSYFNEKGFYYVHTPIISTSDAEGAGEQFQVTTFDLDAIPRTPEGTIDYAADFFGKKAALTVSGQLQGETYALALKNIYTFGPTFRAENSNTKRHLSEFWMIEPEMSFCTLEGNMTVAEEFLKSVFSYVLDHCADDMAFFSQWVEKGVADTLRTVVDTPFAHMTYTDAVAELVKSNDTFDFPVHWGSDLQTEHERFLTEQVCKGPVIVTDYPKEIKAFYMKLNDDGKTVRAMDVLVPRLGEIIGGSERESRLDVLTTRMTDLGLDPADYWWYLDLRRFGSVPHAGFGLGFDRAIQYITGMQNIRDVIPFPRAAKQAEF
ncbi:MAG: asparagine--tRNA ligase [Sphaerochaetaceae bacterium]|jgi:asparaginyl-tRNA synthetase|nr:asparagine--tRNA ligase [Sphaerochaetaceae bacterium]MDD3941646.1 asparagine--tRNA ligase [Sphaerochaetaceae bacterium]MDX9939007.1 asparagine--tRNA ligase [Sphaerochaetaceae bacterium]